MQVELGFILQAGTCQILNFAQNPRQSQNVQDTELNWEGGTPHILSEQGANTGWTPHIKTGSQYKLQVRLTAGWVVQ